MKEFKFKNLNITFEEVGTEEKIKRLGEGGHLSYPKQIFEFFEWLRKHLSVCDNRNIIKKCLKSIKQHDDLVPEANTKFLEETEEEINSYLKDLKDDKN